jgi:hypothetical protein
MNWDAIGAVGAFVGGAAVVVTLVILLVQLRQLSEQTRQHTLAIKFSSYNAHAASLSSWLHATAMNAELSKILLGGHSAAAYGDESLDELGWHRYALALRAIFIMHQNLHEQHERGLIDAAFWNYALNWLKQLVSGIPALKGWWEREKAAGAYLPAFVEAVESIETYSPGEYLYRAATSASGATHV